MTLPRFAATSYDFTEYVPARNWIGGAWREALGTPASQPVPNPRWGRTMSSVPLSGAADVDAAVAAAQAAFPAWRDLPIRDRAQVLYRTRELLLRDLTELSWLVSHENGKIYSEAEAEVLKAIECLEYGCSLPNLATGSELEVSRGVTCGLTYEPLGVVAGVVPFNFPLMVPMWMLPQALVGGNAFILKPSERVPLSSMRLAELFAEAGLPPGILSLVQGGKEVVEGLCDHPGIAALGFVGSTRVARSVYARACASGKRALCLGGAKNHLILVPDADPEVAVENIVASFTGCAGQRCMAASVLLAVGDPAEIDPLLGRIAARAAEIRLGSEMGPVATAAAAERITTAIAKAAANGARVLVDGRGRRPDQAEQASGWWVGPTILDGVDPSSEAGCEEIFGPVLSIVRVPTLEAALRIEGDNPYGNAATVYTTSGDVARRVMATAEAGMCGVNVGVPVPREPFSFGGWNDSCFGHGNITGWDGYRFWTRQRKITTKWAVQRDSNWMS
jgi:malonate-semialdehyde dehydrogenase (acetylating)/methylmalonate-semialdehyde dehydrogenase